MSKKKIIIAILVLALLTVASVFGMLYVACELLVKYLSLGEVTPYLSLPLDLIKFGAKDAKAFGAIALLVSIGLPVLLFGLVGYAALAPRKRELHGSARFATRQELIKSGLLQPDKPGDKFPSIVVGKHDKDLLLFRGQQFMFLAAPTRSGKGVGIVIPNLLHYRDSVVVLDIKGENFEITSGFRAKCGQEVHKFAPDDEEFQTACWNPLAYVRDDPRFRISDLMGITNILYPPSDDVWASTAESLFLGLALYIMDTSKLHDSLNVATIKKMRVGLGCLKDEETFMTHVKEREPFEPLSEDCITHLRSFAQTSDKLRNSIGISFDQPLGIFSDPITAKATATNSFDLRDVRRKRMSIYVVIKPANIDKFGKFLNLFFQQLLVLNMDKLPQDDPSLKCQCLLLLDEFPAMGRIAIIEKASAYMAGYNMRLLLIFQSKSQVKDRKLYDETGAQTMLTNMALQVVYAPRDDNDAKDYSEMIGYMTEKSLSKSRQLGTKSGHSESESDQRRAVMLPQEIKAIGMAKEIISMENMPPALVDKIFWYQEPVFQARANLAQPAVPDQSELLNSIEPTTPSPTLYFQGAIEEQAMPSGATFEVGFSPKRNALEVVMSFVLGARTELLVAAYSFTSKEIAFALVEAKARGVDVRVVVDHAQNTDDQGGYKAVDYLSSQGIPVFRCENYAAMHHKFMVADGIHIQLGSFNYTSSANLRNAETAVALRNAPELACVYRTEWMRLSTEPKTSIETIMAVDRGLAILKEFGI
ncbi:conjugal transfer protein TraG (plasmid) [Verminephrobacter aporrectodeae subsp. tuberculatae]|uniref:type IV secretory system conjugative DNA transfer family protein n=1 Tax=Verminephrobacter aporrectodeae TaxID=1110389 RepID=UPI002237414B|nr:type IV secretory system conjugative DNA transfer family protein [Verminephrobacter aporrectodeae]MCW5223641.1 conjugal transfer protein TraG [Verminephrobacter aporrectodeae subsp. tuberculatae]MCW5291495.1 conjugal transfer protein TraG [Verminephrobacter aporrectodeae subsp. tuberculatae]